MKISQSVNTSGLDTKALKSAVDTNIRRGLLRGAQVILTESTGLVPVETGNLQASGQATTSTDATPTAEVSYNTVYARIQHEATHFNHPRGGQAKYLTAAAEQQRETVQTIVAAAIKGAVM